MRNTFLFIACCLYSVFALALEEQVLLPSGHGYATGNQDVDVPEVEEPTTEQTKIGFMDYSRDWLADYIHGFSHDVVGFFIDTFFGDDLLGDDVKGSRAKLSFFTRRELGKPVDYNLGISVKLVLPNTNERLNLLFESSEEDDELTEGNALQTVDNVEYSTALRFIVKETERWSAKLDTGVKWALPPDPFTRLRFRRIEYFDEMRLRATQSFFWSLSDGAGEDTDIRLDRPLNLDRMLRYNAGARYMLNNDYFELRYGVSLFHELNSKEVLAYYFRAAGDTIEDATFNNYGVGVRYRRQIYKDWVFAEVNPELETAAENEYDVTPIIMFRFEALIGD